MSERGAASRGAVDAPRAGGALAPRSPYLVSAGYDWVFFLLPPLLALGFGILISGTAFTDEIILVNGEETTAAAVFLGSLIHAHLVAVFFRSHGNPRIFALYPYRFVLVPLLLWGALLSSVWLAITATVVATFWDVWHSGAQTFGFARIYDRNAGNPSALGRRLDYWLNQLLYLGPILAGATLMDHVEVFESYEDVGSAFFTSIPARVEGIRRWLTWTVIGGGTLFIAFYLFVQVKLWRRGYRVSWLKIYLLATTGLCSIYTWGFNSWGEAFFIMNSFHAVQYLALVWATERKTIVARLGLAGGRYATACAALVFFGAVTLYGIGAQLIDTDTITLWAATMVVSLMHFWYDGFIWSVTRQQI